MNLRKDAEHRENESRKTEEQGDQCPSALNDIGSTHVERCLCAAETVAMSSKNLRLTEKNVEGDDFVRKNYLQDIVGTLCWPRS